MYFKEVFGKLDIEFLYSLCGEVKGYIYMCVCVYVVCMYICCMCVYIYTYMYV